MISSKKSNYTINLMMHIFLLFTFLTILFFTYISKVEQSTVSEAFSSLINSYTPQILSQIQNEDNVLNGGAIDWSAVNSKAQKMVDNHQGNLQSVEEHNNNLLKLAIGISSGLLVLLIGGILFFKYFVGYDIHLKHIFAENIIIFLIVGAIEILFFLFIASKYTPVPPDAGVAAVISQVQSNLTSKIE